MSPDSLSFIFLNTVLANNFVLAMFLGLCPFLGVSGKLNTAIPMGIATLFVMLVSSFCAYAINLVLVALDIEFLRLITYIAIIASAVQLVEMALKKYSPSLFRSLGIFLPLITTNCAILGVALFQTFKEYNFSQSLVYASGAGIGFILATLRTVPEKHSTAIYSQQRFNSAGTCISSIEWVHPVAHCQRYSGYRAPVIAVGACAQVGSLNNEAVAK